MLSEESFLSGVQGRQLTSFVRGKMQYLWDAQGSRYIDMGASYGVCNVGHCNPEVVRAVSEQARTLMYISQSYGSSVREEMLSLLADAAPNSISRFFLCSSGTEAVEAAVKFALHATGRTRMTAAMRGFHGRTLGSLALTWKPKYRKGFENVLVSPRFVRYNDVEALKEAVDSETAFLILEMVQGEGGVHVAEEEFVRAARDLCTDRGAVLIVDEVQTGLGRTGKMFAAEHYGTEPDIITIGKSLGGGLPIAAAGISESLGQMPRGMHGSTFGGNPLCCAAAAAVLRYTAENSLPSRARDLGYYFMQRLSGMDFPGVREIRGVGLMLAVELTAKNSRYLKGFIERGVAPLPSGGTVLRFLPPLVIERKDIDHTCSALEEMLSEA